MNLSVLCVTNHINFSSLFDRLRADRDSSRGEGCGHWRQLFQTGMEENTRRHWLQNHLEPLPRWAPAVHITLIYSRTSIHHPSVCFYSGGEKKSEIVSSSATSFTITDLPASTAYKIQLSAMVRSKEGSSVMVTARTREFNISGCLFSCICTSVFIYVVFCSSGSAQSDWIQCSEHHRRQHCIKLDECDWSLGISAVLETHIWWETLSFIFTHRQHSLLYIKHSDNSDM